MINQSQENEMQFGELFQMLGYEELIFYEAKPLCTFIFI